jgi:uncharacterized membrane protein YdjX (TVP38/TMEM64 family)
MTTSRPTGTDDAGPGDRWKRALLGGLLVSVAVVGVVAAGLAGREYVTAGSLLAVLETVGPFAPLLFVALQTLQVIVAPVPGQILAGVGGYLFGPLVGTGYSMLGVVLGSIVVFVLTRRYGERVVERLLTDGLRTKFERYGSENGAVTLFVFFLLPTFPDDALCAIAGLWEVRFRTFLVLLVVGRTPSFFAAAYAGTSVHSGAIGQFGILVSAVGIVTLVVYLRRDWIRNKLGSDGAASETRGT